jgi:hypothetical protein
MCEPASLTFTGPIVSGRSFRALLFVACLLPAAATDAQQFVSTGRDTLRGLTGLEIVVESLSPELQRAGLSTEALRSAIERRLHSAGVTVYPSQRANPGPAQPYLYLHTNAISLEQGSLFAVAIQVQVRQTLQSLVTGSKIVDAMTWDSHDVVVLQAPRIGEIQAEIQSHVDRFVEDWAAVH